jgi:hypothetical protein
MRSRLHLLAGQRRSRCPRLHAPRARAAVPCLCPKPATVRSVGRSSRHESAEVPGGAYRSTNTHNNTAERVREYVALLLRLTGE